MQELPHATVANTFASIETYISRIAKRAELPPFCIGVCIAGDTRYLTAGRRDNYDESRTALKPFNVSCLFKPLLAATTLSLAERAEIDLDAPLYRYLPELADAQVGRQANVRNLISHTAGHRGFFFFPPLGASRAEPMKSAFARLSQASQIFRPGCIFNYENSVTAMLGEILFRVTGLRAERLVSDAILVPLGVPVRPDASSGSHTSSDVHISVKAPPPPDSPSHFQLSVPGLLEVVKALAGFRRNHRDTGSILSDRTLASMRESVVQIPRSLNSSAGNMLPIAYGMGLGIFRSGFVGYDGVTPTQAIGFRFRAESGIALVLGIDAPAQKLRRTVLSELSACINDCLGPQAEHDSDSRSGNSQIDLSEIEGTYVGNHAWDVEIRPIGATARLTVFRNTSILFQKAGHITCDGALRLDDADPMFEPTFFRDHTDELCLTLGMSALKKVPVVVCHDS